MSSSRSKRQFQGQISQNLILIQVGTLCNFYYSRHVKSPKIDKSSLLGQAWHLASMFYRSIRKVLSKEAILIYLKRVKNLPISKMAKVTHSVQKKLTLSTIGFSGMSVLVVCPKKNLNMADSCIRWNNKLKSSCDRNEADSWCCCPS